MIALALLFSPTIDIETSSATTDTISSDAIISSATHTELSVTSSGLSSLASSMEGSVAAHTVPPVSTRVSSTVYSSPIVTTAASNGISVHLPVIPSSAVFNTPVTRLDLSPVLRTSSPHLSSIAHVTTVKLPKLTLKKFNRDLVKWATFWDTFESSVHTNPRLTDIYKFNYLKSLLKGPAYEAISGPKLTAANYCEALEVLKKRFKNKKHIIDKHMQSLVNIEAVTSQHNIRGLRRFYDSVEAQIRGLRSLGMLVGAYGP